MQVDEDLQSWIGLEKIFTKNLMQAATLSVFLEKVHLKKITIPFSCFAKRRRP